MHTDNARAARHGAPLMMAAALPPLVMAAAVAVMLAAGLAGRHPMWRVETLNMTEAAAARDVASIAAMLERGEDPDAPRPIRAPLLDSIGGEMTPLEAGVAAGRLEVVHLLLTRGAAVDEARRVELACRALGRGYTDVAEFLAGSASSLRCGR